MELLVFKGGFFRFEQFQEMLDKIEEISWCDIIEFLGALREISVQFHDCVVDVHNRID